MKKIFSGFVLLAGIFGAASLKAQTADEIINKYIDAVGGKDKISQITSLYMEGTVAMMGNDNPTKVFILNGKGYKTETEFNGQKMVRCYTDKSGWAVNPMAGGGAAPMPDVEYNAGKEQIYAGGPLYDYAARGSAVTLLGKEGNAYKIKLVTKDKDESTFFIDAASYLLSKIVKKGNVMGQEVEINIQLADYKKTDFGFMMPFTMNTDLGQFQLSTTITKVEVNKAVDAGVFVMPK